MRVWRGIKHIFRWFSSDSLTAVGLFFFLSLFCLQLQDLISLTDVHLSVSFPGPPVESSTATLL